MLTSRPENSEEFCKSNIDRMLRNSQTKVIFPVITLALLEEYRAIYAPGQTKLTN
jgi:hypothetical protein